MASNAILYLFAIAFSIGGIGFVFIFPHVDGTNDALTIRQRLAAINNNMGYWGRRTSEFDWCEYNYQHSYYVAETWNTLSGFIYIVGGAISYFYYGKILQSAPKRIRKSILYLIHPWLWLFLCSLGLCTMFFHITLQYFMELLDELSMMHLVSWAYICMAVRNDTSNNKHFKWLSKPGIVLIWNIFLTIWGLLSYLIESSGSLSNFHKYYRLFGSITFLIVSVLGFSNLLAITNECNLMDKKNHNQMFINSYFNRCGVFSIFGVICWVVENVLCEYTNLLQLHASAWHGGTFIGIYYGSQIILYHRLCKDIQYLEIENVDVIPRVLSYVHFRFK